MKIKFLLVALSLLGIAFSHEKFRQEQPESRHHQEYTPSNFSQTESQILLDQAKLVGLALTSVTIVTATLYYTHDTATAACVFYPLFLYAAILGGKFALDMIM